MRLTLSVPVSVLAAAAAADADKCAVCLETLLPGAAEIAWHLVFNRTVADMRVHCILAVRLFSLRRSYVRHRFQGKGR